MAIDINNLPTGQVPSDVQQAFEELLNVQGRVVFPLKPTTVSAVSTSAQEDTPDIADAEKEIDELVDSVVEMEDLVEQLEDMVDQLIKDMAIPVDPSNTSLLKAVRQLGGTNQITQKVFNTALAIIDNAGPITFRQDAPTAALTGDGHIDGPWLECSQVTDQVSNFFDLRSSSPSLPEEPVYPRNDEIVKDFEGNLFATILHIVLMLWWNMIWPKFLVDLVIIDPLRMMIGYPLDGISGFFKEKERFRKKNKEWLKKYGRINKALNKFRKFLLCKVPYKLWSSAKQDYDPIVKINCPVDEDYTCTPDKTQYEHTGASSASNNGNFEKSGDVSEMGTAMDIADGEICGSPEDYGAHAPKEEPSGLGMSPECLAAAAKVVRAVEDSSYTPPNPSESTPTLQTNVGTTIENNFLI